MNDGADIMALNLAWLGWEMARWQDVIDWGLSLAGACTLLAINIVRLRKMLRQRRDVNNQD
jgi:hypothetical protein